jgi:NitT/TauT family transport system permease protein
MKVKFPEWLYLPNVMPKKSVMCLIFAFWFAGFLIIWQNQPFELIPKPLEVINAYPSLLKMGLLYHLIMSFWLFLEALAIAVPFSLSLAYLSKLATGYPVARFVGMLRFLSLTGLPFIFTVTLGGGHTLKLAMLVFGISVFYTEGMVAELRDLQEDIDQARVLKFGEWHILYEVVILGTIDKAFNLLKQNSAMVWMMLTVVEGLSRSDGGVGVMLLNTDKHLDMASVFALQASVLMVGFIIQISLSYLQSIICKWEELK